MNERDTTTHQINMAVARAVQSLLPDAAISVVRNMNGVERVIFIEGDGRSWVVAVDPLSLP